LTRRAVVGVLAAALTAPAAAQAQSPIPGGDTSAPAFTGGAWTPQPVFAPLPPRHPFMAPDRKSVV